MNFSTKVNLAKLFNSVYLSSSLQMKKANVEKNWTLKTKLWYVKKKKLLKCNQQDLKISLVISF